MLTAQTRIRVKAPLPLPRRRELTGETRIRLSQIVDLAAWVEDRRKYKVGEISESTGLLKTRSKSGEIVWVDPQKGDKITPEETPTFWNVPKSLGASAKQYPVSVRYNRNGGKENWKVDMKTSLNNPKWYLKEGTKIKKIFTMDAGKDIKDIKRLIKVGKEVYNKDSKVEDWKKRTGIARVTNGKQERTIVVHWYECANIGKMEFKEKPPKELEWELKQDE